MSPPGDSPSILLVEDDDLLRELYRAALNNAGVSVTPVADGMSTGNCLPNRPPDRLIKGVGETLRHSYPELRNAQDADNSLS